MSIELETLALAKAYTDKHVGRPTDEQTAEAVSNYLDQHPVQPYDDTEIKGEVASVKADLTKFNVDYKPLLSDTKTDGGVTTTYDIDVIAGNTYKISNVSDRFVDIVVGVKNEQGATIETLATINKDVTVEKTATKNGKLAVYSNAECSFIIENTNEIYYKVNSMTADVNRCLSENNEINERIDNLEGVGYPDYFNANIFNGSNSIKAHMQTVGKDGYSFIFCTDLHWANNEKHSPAIINKIRKNTFIDKLFLGGDYINNYPSSKGDAIYYIRECISAFRDNNTYPMVGNHDRNTVGTSAGVYMTDSDLYSSINSWIDVANYGDNIGDYYIDDNKTKTRVFCINTGFDNIDGGVIKESTFTWLSTHINELSSDWHVIVLAHWLFSVDVWNRPLVDGVLTGHYTDSANRLFTYLDGINSDSNKPSINAIVTGHVHCDYVDHTSGNIPIIYTDTDSKNTYGGGVSTVGTINEQCFDVITIDYNNATVYCDRIGRGSSRVIT